MVQMMMQQAIEIIHIWLIYYYTIQFYRERNISRVLSFRLRNQPHNCNHRQTSNHGFFRGASASPNKSIEGHTTPRQRVGSSAEPAAGVVLECVGTPGRTILFIYEIPQSWSFRTSRSLVTKGKDLLNHPLQSEIYHPESLSVLMIWLDLEREGLAREGLWWSFRLGFRTT